MEFHAKLSRVESLLEERRRTKLWLAELRKAQGWERGDVAEMLGTSSESIKNWELPSRGFANGFTLIRYLRLLGVLADEAPVTTPGLDRLAALEEKVDEALAGIGDILAVVTHGEDGADAQEGSP